MPGICGIIGSASLTDDLTLMTARMCHDVTMKSGHLWFKDRKFGAGWVDHPERGATGFVWNEEETVCLVFAGEEFSNSEPCTSSQQRKYAAAHSKASKLIQRYEQLGTDFWLTLNGWFSGLLVDLRRETVTLFNDRYGLGRIYIHESPRGLFFSSEAKSLLAALPRLRRIDERGLAEFFSVGCVLQNRTLFDGISLLPAGSLWTFHRDGRREKRRYFDCSTWEQQDTLPPAEYEARLSDIFKRIAPRYSGGGGQIAMSLTGGLDSRLILAWARARPGSLPCYTFGGPYRDCADVHIARRLATIAGQPHTTIRIEPDFFSDFPALAQRTVELSDGSMDVSGAVELYVNQRAMSIAPLRLTGNYGSEILRSNVAFRPRPVDASLFTPEFRQFLDLATETYRHEATGHRLSFIAFKQVPWHHYARFSIEKSQLTPRSPYLDNDLVRLAYCCPKELQFSAAPVLRSVAQGNPALDAVCTDRALRSQMIPVFSRLSNCWQEFTAKAEYAYDYGMPPWLTNVDRIMKPLRLEQHFLGRHKFYHFRLWYRDELRSFLRSDVLDANCEPSCYNKGTVRKLVEEHTTGKVNRTLELHKLLTVQLIESQLVGASCHN